MLHQSVKPIWKTIIELLETADPVGSQVLGRGDKIPYNLIYVRIKDTIRTKSMTVLRVSPDLAKRMANALSIWMPASAEPEAPGHAGDLTAAMDNKLRRLYRVLSGAASTQWYVLNTFGAHIARDQGLPENTIQIDVVRDGVICRNEPYTQYAFDELIRSIEHAEAQQ